MRLRYFLVLMVICFCSTSCMDQEVRLEPDELGLIDSLYLDQRGVMIIQFEDTCGKYHDLYFEKWVDSLMNERLTKIKEMMQR